MIYSNHEVLKHLRSQTKFNKRHEKWIEFLEKFPYIIKHKNGKINIIVDVLSRRYSLLSMLETKFLAFDHLNKLYDKYEFLYKSLIFVLKEKMELSTFVKDFFLRTKNVRELLVKKAHEDGLMRHFGKYKTYKTLLEHFFVVHEYAKAKVQPHGYYTPPLVLSMP
ncbi:hypothetical protein CR513_56299, partial [Mucuna pruriens]